jgi:DNA recombination protein RmuC
MSTTLGTTLALLIGLLVGIALGYLIARTKSNETASQLAATQANLQAEQAKALAEQSKSELLNTQLDSLRAEQGVNIRLDEALKAVNQNMSALTTQAQEAEVKRATAEASVKTQIENMRLGNETLVRETTKLAGALSNAQTRGKFGETQLEMLLENAGLQEGVHFVKQDYRNMHDEISKPDIKIAFPGGREIFIDSKFPFSRFLDAIGEKDSERRTELMQAHAKDLMGHVTALAKRGYQDSSQSPDFVVLFAPFESILTEALEVDPQILNKAFEKNVAIATPTMMMALLRTVAYGFNQADMAKNASAIKDLAGELLKRIGKVHGKLSKLGDSIKSSEKAYNDVIQSVERNMLAPARKMVNLGVPSATKLKSIESVDDDLRIVKVLPELENLEGDGEGDDE